MANSGPTGVAGTAEWREGLRDGRSGSHGSSYRPFLAIFGRGSEGGTVTHGGRICFKSRRVNLSQVDMCDSRDGLSGSPTATSCVRPAELGSCDEVRSHGLVVGAALVLLPASVLPASASGWAQGRSDLCHGTVAGAPCVSGRGMGPEAGTRSSQRHWHLYQSHWPLLVLARRAGVMCCGIRSAAPTSP
jgi:hypothetical protein